MIEARITHALDVATARERLERFFELKRIGCTWDAERLNALVTKALPFVGEARARVSLRDGAVDVEVTHAPAFPSPETIQRMIVDELTRVLV